MSREAPKGKVYATPEEFAIGAEIVRRELGVGYVMETGLPHNVGVKGDQRVYGESVLIVPPSKEALEKLINSCTKTSLYDEQDHLGAVSTDMTNAMPNVTKVLIDITQPPLA
jgi:GMP synthase PP-ATPase subunit